MIFNTTHEPSSAETVSDFERSRNIKLPEDYVAFLLDINGGGLNPEKSAALIDGWNWLMVSFLLGLTSNPEHSISNHVFTNFSDDIHRMMLMIGNDPFGEAIFMDLRPTSHGKIYVRAHNSPPNYPILVDDAGFEDEGDYEEASLFHPVADSWTEFVAMLGPAPQLEE